MSCITLLSLLLFLPNNKPTTDDYYVLMSHIRMGHGRASTLCSRIQEEPSFWSVHGILDDFRGPFKNTLETCFSQDSDIELERYTTRRRLLLSECEPLLRTSHFIYFPLPLDQATYGRKSNLGR